MVKQKEVRKWPDKRVNLVAGATDAETYQKAAALICGSDLAAYRVINAVDGEGGLKNELDVPSLMKHLRDQAGAVQGGNMAGAEAMLINQATALQSLFARLVERGMCQTIISNMESLMKLALRSQNQCRATLETLAAIKNPPVVFAKQANIANGPQQVNNGTEGPRAQENKIEQTQLLEDIPRERLDFGTKKAASGIDPAMATVGKVNRAKDRGRQAS